jgi:hypothetical protein
MLCVGASLKRRTPSFKLNKAPPRSIHRFHHLSPQQCRQLAGNAPCALGIIGLFASRPVKGRIEASWRSGYAEDCKSLHPGSIPGEASNFFHNDFRRLKTAAT